MITLRNLYRTDVFRVRSPNPWLADMVRADATEIPERDEADSSREKIEALAEIICGLAPNRRPHCLSSVDPTIIANTVKHFAFTRCGELNVYGMVEAHIAVLESELLT